MTFDPKDFLDFATALAVDSELSEAEYRSAISRAYYAVHLHARQQLTAQGRLVAAGARRDHGSVIDALRAVNRTIEDQVDRLRVERNRSDYDLEAEIDHRDALAAITLAQSVWRRI